MFLNRSQVEMIEPVDLSTESFIGFKSSMEGYVSYVTISNNDGGFLRYQSDNQPMKNQE